MTFSRHTFFKFVCGCIGLIVSSILAFLFVGWSSKTVGVEYGVTFSKPYAEELGLNSDHVLQVALDEIGIRRFRIAAYRSIIEPIRGERHWEDLDYIISEIGKRHGQVILGVGEKMPRWPECWSPEWWKKLSRDEQKIETVHFIEAVIMHFRGNSTIVGWQIENEPHFYYGDCPKPDYLFLQKETAFARGLDPTRPISTTDSGELSSWVTVGAFVDTLGVSVYRTVRNPLLGNTNLHYWFLPPYFYMRKAILGRIFGIPEIYVSEFQMEPWNLHQLYETTIEEHFAAFNKKSFDDRIVFVKQTGFDTVYLWGAEWWYWLKTEKNMPEFWEKAKALYRESGP